MSTAEVSPMMWDNHPEPSPTSAAPQLWDLTLIPPLWGLSLLINRHLTVYKVKINKTTDGIERMEEKYAAAGHGVEHKKYRHTLLGVSPNLDLSFRTVHAERKAMKDEWHSIATPVFP